MTCCALFKMFSLMINLLDKYLIFSCCCLPTPLTFISGGGESDLPSQSPPSSFFVHLASSSVTPVAFGYCVFCLYCEACGCRCSCMGSMSVSSCRCCMFVSCVHPVAILNAAFCMTCNLLMLVEDERGNHMAYSRARLMTAL